MNLDERVIDLVQYRLKSSKERLNSPRILLDIFINQDLKIYVKPALVRRDCKRLLSL